RANTHDRLGASAGVTTSSRGGRPAVVASTGSVRLNAALALAEQGIPVFPVWFLRNGQCACGDRGCGKKKNAAKHPIGHLVPHGLKDATTDHAAISRWWRAYP